MKHNRRVNSSIDTFPESHHRYEAKLISSYIDGASILDIGCWTGQFLSLCGKAKKRTGIDISAPAIAFARRERKGVYRVASALNLPFQGRQFDIVTMWDVIEHLPSSTEDRAISEVVRVLKPGGVFAMSTVTNHPLSILLDPAFFLIGHRHYSESFLRLLLERHDLRVLNVVYTGGIWTLIDHNFGLLQKYIVGNKLFTPFKRLADSQEHEGGFNQIHLIAQMR